MYRPNKYNYIFQTTEAGNTSAETQYGMPSAEPEIVESTSQPPKKASKRKPTNDDANDTMLKKACSIMMQDDDEFDVFGNFVASELRCLKRRQQEASEVTSAPRCRGLPQSTRVLQKVVTALPDACSRMISLGRMRKLLGK